MKLFFILVDADAWWVVSMGQAWKVGRFEKDCKHVWEAYWTGILGGHEWQPYKKGSTTAPVGMKYSTT